MQGWARNGSANANREIGVPGNANREIGVHGNANLPIGVGRSVFSLANAEAGSPDARSRGYSTDHNSMKSCTAIASSRA
jgi:hypothetical protein